ncbi:NAD(P)-binding protein [Penicillium maclennaniae]|uniref:NAD(P)-binding protein n=1 Tax=Penicillium maclennaniae TaxID=1343394 RepID=UPI00254151D8|nr:NAD(P)-binding protein [Penicillium maclennaniae]KAJ5668364.1 NAD(P)-binding protein [Penicillium maclennaniae]
MTRVLLTGGSGFIAAHVLEVLLARGHSVVTTVRSRSKADAVKRAHPDIKDYRLSFAIVEDIAVPNGTILQNLNSEVETKVIADQANESPTHAYRASKTFAERAAWDFVEREKPNFTLSVINPPLLGPIVHSLTSLETLNTSNQRIRDLLSGAAKARCPPTGNYLFVDARDLALAHVLAVEKSEAGGQAIFHCLEPFLKCGNLKDHQRRISRVQGSVADWGCLDFGRLSGGWSVRV